MDTAKLDALQTAWTANHDAGTSLPGRLPLNKVTLMPSVFQCRAGANQRTGITEDGKSHLAGLTAELKLSGKNELESVTVLRVNGRNVLIDGHHRFAAYKAAKRPDIPVKYFASSPVDAVLMVGRENRKAKLTMSSAERSQWAWELVKARKFSKSQVSAASGASDGSVGNMRRELKSLEAQGAAIPELWRDAQPKTVTDEVSASKQSSEWAGKLTKALGPSKTFRTTGKKAMLRDALIKWSPRLAEDLTYLLAEELDIRAKVEELVQAQAEEMSEEEFERRVNTRAEAMLVARGLIPPPEF